MVCEFKHKKGLPCLIVGGPFFAYLPCLWLGLIILVYAEGGNRTLIPFGNTILSRARMPVPPLRLKDAESIKHGMCSVNLWIFKIWMNFG